MSGVVFRLDAGPSVGLGHAARCVKIAAGLGKLGIETAIEGRLSEGAHDFITTQAPGVEIRQVCATRECSVAVIDLMTDPRDPDAFDQSEIERWQGIANRVVVIHSGLKVPDVGDNVTVVGYQPAGHQSRPPQLYWGLDYAPVDRDEYEPSGNARQSGTVLLALGGAPDWSGHEAVAHALARMNTIARVDILASPVIDGKPCLNGLTHKCRLLRKVESVYPLIERAEVVVASFGNLCYEALHLGSNLIVVGQKAFQTRCGELLAERGYCVSAGAIDSDIGRRIELAFAEVGASGGTLRHNGQRAVDGRGLGRICDLIAAAVDSGRAAHAGRRNNSSANGLDAPSRQSP